MEKVLAKSYARLIKAGRRTIEDVPAELSAAVEAILEGERA